MQNPVARRYAQALYEQAESQGQVARVDADVALLRETFEGSRDLTLALASPVVSREKKQRILHEIFGGKVSASTLRFIDFLFEKDRAEIISDLAAAYLALRNDQEGIVVAHVRTAQEMTEADQQKLRDSLAVKTGKQVQLRLHVEPSLIGGLVVRIGDTVYDGSVRHKLDALREKMEHGTVSLN